MPLEDTNPRLEAIIQEVKTRRVTMYEGRVPRADEMLVAEIERLRARLALADGLAEAVEAMGGMKIHHQTWASRRHWTQIIDDIRSALSAYRNPNPQPPTAGVSDALAAEIDKELKESPDE